MANEVMVRRGQTLKLRYTLWSGLRGASAPKDLTGTTLFDGTEKPMVEVPTMTITDAVNGKASVSWTAGQTDRMPIGRLLFRLGVLFPSGDTEIEGDLWLRVS